MLHVVAWVNRYRYLDVNKLAHTINTQTKMVNLPDTDRYFDVLFTYVRLLIDIPEIDQEICRNYFKPVFAEKDTIIASEGTVHEHHNFIVSGYMRNYHVDQQGQEITTDVNDGPRFFTSYDHFVHRTPSKERE